MKILFQFLILSVNLVFVVTPVNAYECGSNWEEPCQKKCCAKRDNYIKEECWTESPEYQNCVDAAEQEFDRCWQQCDRDGYDYRENY